MGYPSWTCDLCGKKFTHPTKQKVGLAKRMHLLHGHKIRTVVQHIIAIQEKAKRLAEQTKHCIWCGHDVEKLNPIQSTDGYHVDICNSCVIEYAGWIDQEVTEFRKQMIEEKT